MESGAFQWGPGGVGLGGRFGRGAARAPKQEREALALQKVGRKQTG
jgi:hypothetical protein